VKLCQQGLTATDTTQISELNLKFQISHLNSEHMNPQTIKTIFAVTVLATALFVNMRGTSPGYVTGSELFPETDQPYRTEVFRVTGPATVVSSTSGGNISVEGHTGDEVRVEMVVRQRGRNLSPNDTDLSEFNITIEQQGDRVTASAQRKSSARSWFGGGSAPSISFMIYAPGATATELSTSGGNLSVASLTGNQKMRTSGGNISISNIDGGTEANTSGGNIRVNNHDGELAVTTSGGNITIQNQNGNMTARTSGGRINLEGVSGRVLARTSGGSITAAIDKASESIELHTSGGNIDARLPADAGMTLNVRGSRVTSDLEGLKGTMTGGRIEGTVGDGSIEVNIRTSGGSVRLTH
jgi:hypothetical protein